MAKFFKKIGPSFVSSPLDFILDTLFPPKCFKCNSGLRETEFESICPTCLKQIALIKPPFCNICGLPFNFQYDIPGENTYSCGACRAETYYFTLARSFGKYEGILKEALIKYKYQERRDLLKDIMRACCQVKKNSNFFALGTADLILYVPLHEKRLKSRGFDQAYLIAKEISKLMDLPLKVDLLFKKNETKPQAGLKKQERIKNLKDTFAVRNNSPIKGKNILLVDDVLTTGATVNECSKVLKQNGASRVDVFTLARAV